MTPEQEYLEQRRIQAEALKSIKPGQPWSSEDTRYTEAGNRAYYIAREHGFSDEKCERLNKEAGL